MTPEVSKTPIRQMTRSSEPESTPRPCRKTRPDFARPDDPTIDRLLGQYDTAKREFAALKARRTGKRRLFGLRLA